MDSRSGNEVNYYLSCTLSSLNFNFLINLGKPNIGSTDYKLTIRTRSYILPHKL